MLAGYLEGEHNKNIDSLRDGSESKIRCSRSRALAAPFFPGAPIYKDGAEPMLPSCEESNHALLSSLRYDQNEEALHKIAFDDWAKGRMTEPKKAACIDTSQVSAGSTIGLE